MATFNVVQIDIPSTDWRIHSTTDPSKNTPVYQQVNTYTLDGVTNADGSLRQMSIGQLVMAICLSRAAELETKIVSEMNEMAKTTDKLENFSKIEADLAAWQKANPTGTLSVDVIKKDDKNVYSTTYPNLYATFKDDTTRQTFLSDIGMSTSKTSWSADEVDEMMQAVEEQMDSLNTISQEQLIDIQSLTSKRDDTYSLISNVLKSLYTVMTGNVNNM